MILANEDSSPRYFSILKRYTTHFLFVIGIMQQPSPHKKPPSPSNGNVAMKPVEFPEQNAVLAKDQPEYLPLPVCRHGDRTISCWKLTFGERLKLLFTGRLWLLVLNFGGPLQPQLPMVESPFVQLEKDPHPDGQASREARLPPRQEGK